MSRDDQLQALLDRQAIAELSFRYSRAADRLDRDLLTSVEGLVRVVAYLDAARGRV